eukprot:COSAG04_NODE_4066_length_2327_cov_3.884201_2_plen_214_part_00
MIVKPIDTSYAVITVAVFSEKNPVFDEGDLKVQPGLPKTKEWGELSAYFRSKAELLGLTDEATWEKAKRGDLARTKSKDHTDAANVLGFHEKSPYQDDPVHPVDDRRFHWASILNQKMAVVQAEGTFGWQHVVYNALEPELKAEFHDPTELSLITPKPTAKFVQFNDDVHSVLQKIKDFEAVCAEIEKLSRGDYAGDDSFDQMMEKVAQRDTL